MEQKAFSCAADETCAALPLPILPERIEDLGVDPDLISEKGFAQGRFLDKEWLRSLSDSQKIDLIEMALSAAQGNTPWVPLKAERDLMERVADVTSLTKTFLEALQGKILSGEIHVEDSRGQPYCLKQDSRERLRKGNGLANLKTLISASPKVFDRNIFTSEDSGIYMAILLAAGEEDSSELDYLIGETELNDAGEIFFGGNVKNFMYRHLREAIAACHAGAYNKFLAALVYNRTLRFIEYMKVGGPEGDEKTWSALLGILYDPPDPEFLKTESIFRAEQTLYEYSPVPQELQNFHNSMGPKFVAAALDSPDLAHELAEAKRNWNSTEWEFLPKCKLKVVKGIYAALGSAFGMKAPKPYLMYRNRSEETGILTHGNASSRKTVGDNEGTHREGIVRFNTHPEGGLKTIRDCLSTAFHEYCHIYEKVILTDRSVGYGTAQDKDAFDAAVQILKFGNDHYPKDTKKERERYWFNPLEKHARWFESLMMNYFHVYETELQEREQPGSAMKNEWQRIDDIVQIARSYEEAREKGVIRKEYPDFEGLAEKGEKFKKEYPKDAAASQMQVEDYCAFLSQAMDAFRKLNRRDHNDFMPMLSERQVDSINISNIDFWKCYASYKQHASKQGYPSSQSPDRSVKKGPSFG